MAYKHGKNTAVLFDGYNLSAYFNEASSTREVEVAETTAFGNSAKTYITGLKDGTASLSGMFDGASGAVDAVLAPLLGQAANEVVTIAPDGGFAKGNRALLFNAKQTSYEVSSPVGDVVSVSADFQADGGIDAGVFIDDSQTVSATGNQTGSHDNSASSSNGAVANLHVTANTRNGNVTFVVQHSSDNSTFADLITFTATPSTTVEGQRVAVTGTVNRYLRTKYTVAGSSGSTTFGIAVARR
jgi:hypothetical protein